MRRLTIFVVYGAVVGAIAVGAAGARAGVGRPDVPRLQGLTQRCTGGGGAVHSWTGAFSCWGWWPDEQQLQPERNICEHAVGGAFSVLLSRPGYGAVIIYFCTDIPASVYGT
jgi:hypothetical protein